jgi:hypothetical protein
MPLPVQRRALAAQVAGRLLAHGRGVNTAGDYGQYLKERAGARGCVGRSAEHRLPLLDAALLQVRRTAERSQIGALRFDGGGELLPRARSIADL